MLNILFIFSLIPVGGARSFLRAVGFQFPTRPASRSVHRSMTARQRKQNEDGERQRWRETERLQLTGVKVTGREAVENKARCRNSFPPNFPAKLQHRPFCHQVMIRIFCTATPSLLSHSFLCSLQDHFRMRATRFFSFSHPTSEHFRIHHEKFPQT